MPTSRPTTRSSGKRTNTPSVIMLVRWPRNVVARVTRNSGSVPGQPQGVGAVYGWAGNKKVGTGRMEILQSSEPSKVIIKLDFFTPFEGHNTAEFTLQPEGDDTRVTWAMFGPDMCPNPLMKFFMGLFFNMEKVVGGQFEDGLAKLKAAAEAAA